jgi:hypothetical protein
MGFTAAMTTVKNGTSRRELLVGVGAAVGVAATSGLVFSQRAGSRSQTLQLRLEDVRHAVPGAIPGQLHPMGARSVPFADVYDGTGAHLGRLDSAIVPGTAGGSVLHTLNLTDGSLLAIGPHDMAGPYAVVGGSGRYAGATGSYQLSDHGAESHDLTITLNALEA